MSYKTISDETDTEFAIRLTKEKKKAFWRGVPRTGIFRSGSIGSVDHSQDSNNKRSLFLKCRWRHSRNNEGGGRYSFSLEGHGQIFCVYFLFLAVLAFALISEEADFPAGRVRSPGIA